MMGWYDNAGMDTGGWIAMVAMMSLFWAAVIIAGILLLRGNTRGSRQSSRADEATSRTPMDILDERFARGEIDNEEYQARKAALLGPKR